MCFIDRKRTSIKLAVLLWSLAIGISCSNSTIRPIHLPLPVETNSIGPGDILDVNVYEEPSMSKSFKVAPDGTIDFPLIGIPLLVEGKEPQQVSKELRELLKTKKILKNPSVSVYVKEVHSKKITVLGQVQKPGQYSMTEGTTLVQAISLAGGFTPLADKDRVILIRKLSKSESVRVLVSVSAITEGKINDVPLQAGDQITVEQNFL